ncbi:MAG: hypothetical protein IJU86_04480 [Firmicutes bacterium]|nr:hypothetical protein [Bacillota bacterium]
MLEHDSGSESEVKTSQQSETFHDFVFGQGNAERLWKIADEIAKSDLDYFSQHSGYDKLEPVSNFNVAKYFKKILIDEENDIISNDQREKIKIGKENDIYSKDNLDEDVLHNYDEIFGKENNNKLGEGDTVDKLIFTESWYNKTREYCRSGNNTLEANRNKLETYLLELLNREKLKSYLLELLKCMVIVDILSIKQDDSCKDLINSSNDFEAKIKSYLSDESNIKRRLRFFASKYDGGNSGHRGKTQLVAQFCQKYLAYRLNDQKVSVDKDKNEKLVNDSSDWVEENRIAIISFVKCHIDRLMNHNKVETKIQLSVSNNVTGNLLKDDDCIKDNGACIITSSQLANQLKETNEFEEYFLYAKNGINLPSLGVDFNDFCKIILDHKFDDMDEDENGIQHLRKTMSLDEFVELFIIWKELDFDDQNNDESENAYKNTKSYLYESDCYEINQRVDAINKYLSEKNKLKTNKVKKIIDKKTDQKINKKANLYEQNESPENNDKDKQTKIKWWKNIWLWRFLSLGATILNLMLMIAFINVWFYFIAPLVIFVVLTVVLFIYKPTTKYEVKKRLSSEKPSEFLLDSKGTDYSKEFPNYEKQDINKDPQ